MPIELYDQARAAAEYYFARNQKAFRGMKRAELEEIWNRPNEEQTGHGFVEYSAGKVLQERSK